MNPILRPRYDFLRRFSVVRALCLSYSCTVLSVSGARCDYFAPFVPSKQSRKTEPRRHNTGINITVTAPRYQHAGFG